MLKSILSDSELFAASGEKPSKSTQNRTPKWPKTSQQSRVRDSWIRILTAQSQRNLKTILGPLDPSPDVLQLPRYKTNKGLYDILSVEGQSCYWCSQSRGAKESASHQIVKLADTLLLASLNQKHRGAKHSPFPNFKIFTTILRQTHKVENVIL